MTTRVTTPDILGDIMAGATVAVVAPTTTVPLAAIVNDGGTQMRAGMDADTVKEYEDALTDAEAWPFPPVIVYHDGARYWLADGFHRLNAAHRSGKFAEIPAEIKPGTRRDAVLYAAGANASHGLRRTAADRRRSVEMLVLDDEWGKWSNREIARRCNVDEKLVRQVKKDLGIDTADNPQYTHPKTGETTTMQTTNIGANRQPPPVMLAVWELERVVREVLQQVYGGHPEPYATRDMRTGAQMRAGRFWLLCTQSLPANQFRLSDLAQAINNVASQYENPKRTAPQVLPGGYTVPEAQEDKPLPEWVAGDALEETLRTHFNAPFPTASSDPWLTAAIAPFRRQERATRLADALQPWLREYTDEYGRDWKHLAEYGNPSHSNSTFWQDIQKECKRRNVRIDDDILKGAIKQAFATMLAQHQAGSPATVAQTVADVVEVYGEPAPAVSVPDPVERVEDLPVSQRADYESDEWYTPQEYIDAAKAVMGAIDLDPASSEMAQTVVRAGVYLTRFDDGLAQTRWIHQRVWLNPPYSNPAPWIEKLVREHQAGPFCTEAIVLVNNATETSWFQLLLERFPVCLPARRLAFWRHDHANVGARQGQAFFYLGSNGDRFEEVFRQFGPILRRVA